jgi:hypothetical protein
MTMNDINDMNGRLDIPARRLLSRSWKKSDVVALAGWRFSNSYCSRPRFVGKNRWRSSGGQLSGGVSKSLAERVRGETVGSH